MARGGFPRGGGGGFGGGGGGNMQQMLKQAQKMQAQIEQLQEELAQRSYEAASGGGMVKAVVNGKKEITELSIDAQVVDPEDIEMLQDLVVAAVNEALRTAEETSEAEMGKITGGLPLGL